MLGSRLLAPGPWALWEHRKGQLSLGSLFRGGSGLLAPLSQGQWPDGSTSGLTEGSTLWLSLLSDRSHLGRSCSPRSLS